jgi:hypothetical protein
LVFDATFYSISNQRTTFSGVHFQVLIESDIDPVVSETLGEGYRMLPMLRGIVVVADESLT